MRYQQNISNEDNTPDCETGDSNPFLDSLNAGTGEALPDPVEPINMAEEAASISSLETYDAK